MNIKRLYKLELGDAVTIFNEPFTYVGHAAIELDSGHKLRWLYDDEGRMFSVSVQDEEMILFSEVEDELEPDEEIVLFRGKEYEFEYEDAGVVVESKGEALAEGDDRFLFSDYQTQGGDIVRLVENESTGESMVYVGVYVSDEDVSEM